MSKNLGHSMYKERSNYAFQKVIVIIGILLFFIKLYAWYLTSSIAILTDTLESITNIIAAVFSLYSLYLSSVPEDKNHPYGHGKIEFISAGMEGGLISIAGLIIIWESFQKLYLGNPELNQLDYGIILIAFTSLINYILGYFTIKKGKKSSSLPLIAGGEHLQSDAYSTIGLVIGLIIVKLSGFKWLDSVIALIFGGIIIYAGIKIIRKSLAGIMDEADENLIEKLVDILEKNRNENWIDFHNIRFIKYGTKLHLDCHVTFPWYFNLKEAHREIDKIIEVIKKEFGNSIETFIHTDPCIECSCYICLKKECKYRLQPFKKKIIWTKDEIVLNQKHQI